MPAEKILNIVVTGSSGYVGKKVVQLLRNKNFKVIEVDISDSKNPIDMSEIRQLERLELPAKYMLIHLAFPLPGAMAAEKFRLLINRQNTNMIKVFDPKDALFVSSTAVYALNSREKPVVNPWEVYGSLKYESEIMLSNYFKRLTIFRPGTLVEMNRESLMMAFIRQLKSSPLPFIPGKGEMIHPFTHTNDLISAILCWVNQEIKPNGVFDLTAKNPMTFKQLSRFGREKKLWFFLQIPLSLLRKIGSDNFPFLKISSWHFSALCYNFMNTESNIYNSDFRSYREIFNS